MKSLVIPRLLAPKVNKHFKMLYYHNYTEPSTSGFRSNYRSWIRRIKLLKRTFCGDIYTKEFLPQFNLGHPFFHKEYLYTYKYAKFIFQSNPVLYFELMNLDSSFLALATSPEEALITAIVDAKMRGWNGII
jgi:hypothetical protein